jgi:hypothetical protein
MHNAVLVAIDWARVRANFAGFQNGNREDSRYPLPPGSCGITRLLIVQVKILVEKGLRSQNLDLEGLMHWGNAHQRAPNAGVA